MTRIYHAHSSGRFDRPASAFAAELAGLRRRASVTSHTEVTAPNREAVFKEHAKAWGYFHPAGAGARDTAVTWNRGIWRQAGDWRPYSQTVSLVSWTRAKAYGGGRTAPTHAAVCPLEHITTGEVVVFIVCHMPTRNTALRRFAWRRTAAGLRRLVRRIRRRHPHARVQLALDTNVELRTHDGAALVRSQLAQPLGLANGWRTMPPKGGTHGHGVIDCVLTDVPDSTTSLLPDTDASDHRPIITAGDLRPVEAVIALR